ncbi:MAG: carboxypeptidase regulatory-like domain-containing protein [Pirellulales bacterium]|nr:carboxypeptidase regulatory-like domain-containing protein [Pirellulales bacterium]
MRFNISAFLIVAALAAVGCNSSGGLPVRGTVTLDGAPLENGSISYRPVDPSKTKGSGATIRDGRYEIPASHGLPPGKYLVTISAHRLTGRMVSSVDGTERVPEVAAIVFAEKQPFEATVDASGGALDFRLTSAR